MGPTSATKEKRQSNMKRRDHFSKRGGTYSAVEQELEFEQVPTQNFAYEVSAHATDAFD